MIGLHQVHAFLDQRREQLDNGRLIAAAAPFVKSRLVHSPGPDQFCGEDPLDHIAVRFSSEVCRNVIG